MSYSGHSFIPGRTTIKLCLFLVLLFLIAPLPATEKEISAAKQAKLFSRSGPIAVSITAPWREIERKARYQGGYPAKMEFTDELGKTTTLNLTVERRGLTRQAVCRFPPVKLRFKKKEVKGTTFRGQKSVKMVTHCQTSARFEQFYILEMLAYRMYNIITDFSFRVRPLAVTYVDSKRGVQGDPRFAFLIEDDSDVARRNGQKKLEIAKTTKERLEPRETVNLALFQYMISNLDWSAVGGPDKNRCCHNAKLIGQNPNKDPVYSIPYDFDAAGLIDAPYAVPPDKLPVNDVTQRLYRGFCVHNEYLEDGRQRFLENEQAILALLTDEPLLNAHSRKKALVFLQKFFEILKDDQDFDKKIRAKCRK